MLHVRDLGACAEGQLPQALLADPHTSIVGSLLACCCPCPSANHAHKKIWLRGAMHAMVELQHRPPPHKTYQCFKASLNSFNYTQPLTAALLGLCFCIMDIKVSGLGPWHAMAVHSTQGILHHVRPGEEATSWLYTCCDPPSMATACPSWPNNTWYMHPKCVMGHHLPCVHRMLHSVSAGLRRLAFLAPDLLYGSSATHSTATCCWTRPECTLVMLPKVGMLHLMPTSCTQHPRDPAARAGRGKKQPAGFIHAVTLLSWPLPAHHGPTTPGTCTQSVHGSPLPCVHRVLHSVSAGLLIFSCSRPSHGPPIALPPAAGQLAPWCCQKWACSI